MNDVIVCSCCKKTYTSWHFANVFNSSKFCDICGGYCSTYSDLDDENIERLEDLHKDWLKNNARI